MISHQLSALCDIATEAHTRIQQEFKHIDPVVGVSQAMRSQGVPADVVTIDCLQSGRRILLILHDQQTDTLRYQFGSIEKDPGKGFDSVRLDQLTSTMIYEWMKLHLLKS